MTLTICIMIVVIGIVCYQQQIANRRMKGQSAEDRHRQLGLELYGHRESRWEKDYRPSIKVHSEEFYENLVKTIAHTERIIGEIEDPVRIDYARVLRTCNPNWNGAPLYQYFPGDSHLGVAIRDDSFNYRVVLSTALALRGTAPIALSEPATKGKMLVFEVNITTIDGAPEAESQGFVDNLDIPPIDTWFFVTSKFLYCWIPTMFVPTMQNAIDVEILDSYAWIEEIGPAFNQAIVDRLQSHHPTSAAKF